MKSLRTGSQMRTFAAVMNAPEAGESTSRQRIGPALALASAVLLGMVIPTTSFWIADYEGGAAGTEIHYRVGLSQTRICRNDECQERGLSQLGLGDSWGRGAAMSLGGLVVTAFLLVMVAATFRRPGWTRHLGWVTTILILFTAAMLVFAHLALPFDGTSPGWSFVVAFGGLALGLSAAGLRANPVRITSE